LRVQDTLTLTPLHQPFDAAIGLSLMIAIGDTHFRSMLDGFRTIDEHFRNTPLEQNAPILAALIGIWNRNFLHMPTHAVLPYSQHLDRFPAYLQQLDMESNGKSVRLDGATVRSVAFPSSRAGKQSASSASAISR